MVVTGGSGPQNPPTGNVIVYANGLGTDIVALTPSGPNSASGSSGPQVGDYFELGLNQITAVYTGDATYQESVSGPIILTAVEAGMNPDFSIAPAVPQFSVPASGSASTSINLASIWGFSGTISLTCTTSAPSIGCSIAPVSVNLNGTAVATLTVTSSSASGAMRSSRPFSMLPALLGANAILGCIIVTVVTPRTRYGRRFSALFSILVLAALCVACGGGQMSTQIPPPQQPPPSLNIYSVVVSGTSNGTIHNTKVLVLVQ